MRFDRWTIALASGLLLAAAPGLAQTTGQTQTPPPVQTPTQTQTPEKTPPLPDNLERIRKSLDRPTFLNLDSDQLRIYVEVNAWRSFVDWSKGFDFTNGPGPVNAISNRELFALTQPRDMYGSRPSEMLTNSLVNAFGQMAIKKALKEISETRDEKRIKEIRAQIDRELAALRGGK